MRILIVSAVFPPESLTAAQTACDIAQEMTRRGHEVTVFAPFPNRPAGVLMPGYQRSLKQVEYRDGYRLVRTWHTLSKTSTLISRLSENISFGATSTLGLLCEAKPDVAFLNTWPILAQWMNTSVLSHRRVPVFCAVKDLYPESYWSTAGLHGYNPLTWLANVLSARTLRQSLIVAPLNNVMAERIIASRNVTRDKVWVLPDWVDAAQFPLNPCRSGSFRANHRLDAGRFIAMYAGSFTRSAGLDLYVEAAQCLRHRKDIHLLLVGDGPMRQDLGISIRRAGLENIEIVYPLTPKEVPEVLSAADVLLLSLSPGTADHATPSKMAFYMFSGRPVLASVGRDSPPARIVQESGCGYVVEQDNPAALAGQLGKMADHRDSLRQLGDRGRQYAEQHFAKEILLPQTCDLLERIAKSGGVGGRTLRHLS